MRCHLALVAAVLGGLTFGCLDYGSLEEPDSMDGIQIHEVAGNPGGIYQGPNPPPNTVRDMCNISTHRGRWTLRPGLAKVCSLVGAQGTPSVIAEYIDDHRYETSHYPAIVVLNQLGAGASPACYEYINTESYNTITYPAGHVSGTSIRPSWTRVLKRYTSGDYTKYTPAILFCDGRNKPVVYSQESGAGELADLGSMDGGYSDITYLADAPVGKFVTVFKERVFIANVSDAANRIFFTGPDIAGAWTANVWPSSYNLDIGHAEEITALVPTKDMLLIFTRQRVYGLSGDGVDGVWQVDVLDAEHGCFPNGAADTGKGIVFFGPEGAFIFNGQSSKNISHPALQDSWGVLVGQGYITSVVYDENRNSALLTVGREGGEVIDNILVYDLGNSAWSRWGRFDASNLFPGNYLSVRSVGRSVSIFGNEVLFAATNSNVLFRLADNQTHDHYGGGVAPIHAFIHTNQMAVGPTTKHLRGVGVRAKRNGSWYLSVIPMEDYQTPFEAFTKYATKMCKVISESMDTLFTPDRTCLYDSSSGEKVDFYEMKTLQKVYDGLAKAAVGGSSFALIGGDSFNVAESLYGQIAVVEDDAKFRIEFDMNGPVPTEQFDGDDDWPLANVEFEDLSSPANGIGRSFSLYITNVGTYWSGLLEGAFTYEFAKTCAAIDIESWWVETIDRQVTRRGWTR
jgi:hypothetical protein